MDNKIIIKEDYLDKEGKYAKNWKKRWFVLSSEDIEYYQDENKIEKKGTIEFIQQSMVSDVIVSISTQFMKKTTRYSFTILGSDPDGTIQDMEISSDNESIIRSWQATIAGTIERYIASLPPHTPTENQTITSPPPPGARLSNNARIQRFVVSKMAGSTIGQDVLVKVVGQDFQDMIDCLTGAISKFAGETTSNEMKEHILKLASKLAVLFNDGIISKQEMSSISRSLRDFYRYLVKSMYRPPSLSSSSNDSSTSDNHNNNNNNHNNNNNNNNNHPISSISGNIILSPEAELNRQHEIIQHIFQLMDDFHQFLLPILTQNMSPQNSSRLTSLIEFFHSQNGLFFQSLLFFEEYKEERNQFKSYAKYLPTERK